MSVLLVRPASALDPLADHDGRIPEVSLWALFGPEAPDWRCPLIGADRKWLAHVKVTPLTQSGHQGAGITPGSGSLHFQSIAKLLHYMTLSAKPMLGADFDRVR